LNQQDIGAGFLGRLTPAEQAVLREAMETRKFADGADIVTQGDSTTDCFFLLEGRAMATVYAEDGRLVLLREIGQGAVFGEFAALDGGPRTADVVASGPVTVGRMSRDALFACIERAPGIGRVLMGHLVHVIRLLSERIHEQTTLHVRERLLRELLRLGNTAGHGEDRAVLRPAPTHAVLAANIATHREAVTKQLSAFARLGLITKVPGGLMLPSLRALEKELQRSIG
jgi:CRP-like cAMP-binding protein